MMSEVLGNNPLLLLFIVAAIGYLIGSVNIKGSSLGVSAVLFVGLFFGALDPDYNVPQIIFQLGIVLFVYSIGLNSGPAFFNSFKQNGWRDISFVMVMLALSAAVAIGIYFLLGYSVSTITGIYAGSTTNTPALAGVLDLINNNPAYTDKETLSEQLVVGYTYSYPVGVLGVMFALKLMEKVMKVDYEKEKEVLKKSYPIEEDLTSSTLLVNKEEATGLQLRDLVKEHQWNVVFGRIDTADEGIILANWDKKLVLGDRIMVVGTAKEINEVKNVIGEETENSLTFNRKHYDVRRIFVSNPNVAGQKLSSLNISEKYHAIITRIRRGDIDMLAKGDTVLELGDRIRFIARRKDLKELSNLFGDSYYESSKVNLFSFGLGIALGLLLGNIEFSLPAGINFKLGFAGGPLVVGLLLGAIRRTGPVVWTLPYSANVTLRQVGLIFLLAVIGLRSGNTFLSSFQGGEWALILAGGTIVATLTTIISLFIGYKLIKIPYSLLLGFLSNQPAILDFAMNMSKNKVPLIGYSLMFPIALVIKILYAQLLFILLQ